MYEYFLIQVDNAEEMNQKVNYLLAQGWEPYMGLVIAPRESELRCLFQWMIRGETDRRPPALPPAPPQMEKHHLERGKESLPAEGAGRDVAAAWLHTSVAAGENL